MVQHLAVDLIPNIWIKCWMGYVGLGGIATSCKQIVGPFLGVRVEKLPHFLRTFEPFNFSTGKAVQTSKHRDRTYFLLIALCLETEGCAFQAKGQLQTMILSLYSIDSYFMWAKQCRKPAMTGNGFYMFLYHLDSFLLK